MSRHDRPGSILVTGAARGIGRATAELFLARGWRVGMYDDHVAAVTEAAGGRPNAVSGGLDVRDADQWRTALDAFCGDGALDVLVNNAGILASGPFAGMDPSAHRRMTEVNLIGVLNGCAAGPLPAGLTARRPAEPVLRLGPLRPAVAGHLRRHEGGGQVAHRGPRHRVAGRRHPGAQPGAAVRRYRDGVAGRPRRSQRGPPRGAADRRRRRRGGVAGRARAGPVAAFSASRRRPADPAVGRVVGGHP